VRRRFSAGSIRIQVGDYTIQLVDPPRGQVAALDIPEIIRLVGEVIGVLGEKILAPEKADLHDNDHDRHQCRRVERHDREHDLHCRLTTVAI
jgi:hypothetical protein